MCLEAVDACFSSLQPVINFIDCSYYINSSDISCTYEPVTCEPPPSISNGYLTSNINHNITFQAGSSVKYSCDNEYKLNGNNTAVCQYSGSWKPTVDCRSILHIKIIIIGVTGGIFVLATVVIFIFVYKRKKELKRRANYFENQPEQKRNREFDAFISYTYKASIGFVKDFVHPKLEVESNPPFRLFFHTRNFHAATLIYQNILDGKKSNSAIVIMSQEYIDSSWCREEFQVSRKERYYPISFSCIDDQCKRYHELCENYL